MALTKIVNTGIGTISDPFAVPKGTTSERPVGISSGVIRYNTATEEFEGYKAASWGNLGGGGGATGGGSGALKDDVFYENSTNVSQDYTITSGKNAMSAGPITLDATVVVTIPSGSVWTVV